MKTWKKPLFILLFFTGLVLLIVLALQPVLLFHFGKQISIIFPDGQVAIEERNLLLIIQGIMLLVVIPVYALTFLFSWKYNAQHPTGTYDPDLVDSWLAETIWWGLPCIIIFCISALTWIKTYELDPYKPLISEQKPITIQVVALPWKWLFIYPHEKIATVNFFQFPENTPLHFEITADAPMNSFWIPSLGGQIYAMPGMRTELNLIANQKGDFRGSSANLSGEGFAGMRFIARSSSLEDYNTWTKTASGSNKPLDEHSYEALAAPSQNVPVQTYRLEEDSLFNTILMKYMHP